MPRVTINSPDSALKYPSVLIHDMGRDLKAAIYLAVQMIRRDLSAQYRQTVFGYVWAILPTVTMSLMWVFLNLSNIVTVRTTDVPYPIYALTGVVFWQLFVDSLNAPFSQISSNRSMLTRINFPKEALILSGIGQALIAFLVRFCFLILLLLFFKVSVGPFMVLVIFPVLSLLLIGSLFGVLLLPLGVLYTDVQQSITVAMAPFMLITPVVYPVPNGGILELLIRVNPLTPAFSLVRATIYGNSLPSDLSSFIVVFACSIVLGLSAWIIYRIALPFLVERMEA